MDSQERSQSQGSSRVCEQRRSCPVCLTTGIGIIIKTGCLRKHGHGGGKPPCKGSYGLPGPSLLDPSSITSAFPPRQSESVWEEPIIELSNFADGCVPSNRTDAPSAEFFIPAKPRWGVLKFIPKGARNAAAAAFKEVIDEVVEAPECEIAWRRLLGFAHLCLGKPNKEDKSLNLTKVVLEQIRSFKDDVRLDFTSNSIDNSKRNYKKKKLTNQDEFIAHKACEKLGEGNVKGAVRILCSSEPIVIPDAESLKLLQLLHPSKPLDRRTPPLIIGITFSFGSKDLFSSILSFPFGSSGGFDGLRPQHLKDMVKVSGVNGILIERLSALIKIIISGQIISSNVKKFFLELP